MKTKKSWSRAPKGGKQAVWAGQATVFLIHKSTAFAASLPRVCYALTVYTLSSRILSPVSHAQSVASCIAHYFHGAPTFIWKDDGSVVISDNDSTASANKQKDIKR